MVFTQAGAESRVRWRNNVKISGQGTQPMVFAHGFGCDQNMWRFVAPAFQQSYKIVLYDQVGAGQSDLPAYSRSKYASLDGYVADLLEILAAEELSDVVFVGHSVSAMIGVLAAIREPERFARLVLIGPSPCYINDGEYLGGSSREDISVMLEFLDGNYMGWSTTMGPVIMGNPERPELAAELTRSFCRTDPEIARHFARVTFLSDNRADLAQLRTPALVLQCSNDAIAPIEVGEYVHASLPDSRFVLLNATGHCPNLSAPDETIAVMKAYLE